MNLEGLEMIAVLIVIVLFVKVLEQFGLIEAGLEGKGVLFDGSSFFLFRLCSCGEARGTCRVGVRRCLGHLQPWGLRAGGLRAAALFFRRKNTPVS